MLCSYVHQDCIGKLLSRNLLNVCDRRNKPGDRDKGLEYILKVSVKLLTS